MNRLEFGKDPLSIGYHDIFKQVGAPYTVTTRTAYAPDLISFEYYGTYDFWWLVLQFNGISHPRDLVAGLAIRLPSVKKVMSVTTRGEKVALP